MIRIPTTTHPPTPTQEQNPAANHARGDASDPRRDPFKRRGEREGALREGLSRDPRGTGGDDLSGRSADFSRRIQDAMDERGGHGQDERGRDERRERVLASVQADGMGAAIPFVQPAEVRPVVASDRPSASLAPATDEAVVLLASRIEQAYRADISASAGEPVSLRVPLDGLVEGLRDITVSVTPVGLDVTLTRTFGGAPEDLVQAAQMLASHLQARFSKRSVRILEVVEGRDSDRAGRDGDSLSEIGRLLGRPRS